MDRVYIVPIIGDGQTYTIRPIVANFDGTLVDKGFGIQNSFRAKYFEGQPKFLGEQLEGEVIPAEVDMTQVTLIGSTDIFRAMNYGKEPVMLVGSRLDDATASATHAALTANNDVTALPVNLDTQLTAGAVTVVQNKLEAQNIPSLWVNTSFTYRQVLRMVAGLFQFAQRYHGLHNLSIFRGGVSLATQFNQLPAQERQRLLDAAKSFNYDTSGLSGASAMRQILKNLADQWGNQPLFLGPVEI